MSHGALADARTEARGHFKKGMGAIASGKYEQGIEELQRAYEILPHPNVLYNIGRAYVEMGDLENAIAYYKRYIDENPPDKEEVRTVVGQLQARLDRQKAALAAAQQTTPTTTPSTTTPGTTTSSTGTQTLPEQPGQPTTIPPPGTSQAPGGAAAARPPEAIAVGASKTEEVYEESVVTASRGAAQTPLESPNATTIITEQDIRLSGIVKIPELLRRVPGIDIAQVTAGWTEVSIRGFNQRVSNKVLVLIDGRSVFLDYVGGTLWESLSIDVDQIERIEVVRGPGSALYGADAFGGVVNIITKPPGTGRTGFRAGVGEQLSTYGSMRATGRVGDSSYRVSGGYTYNPRWSLPYAEDRNDINHGTDKSNRGSEFSRLDARTTHRLGRDVVFGIGGGLAIGSMDFYGPGATKGFSVNNIYTGDVTAYINTKKINFRSFYNFFHAERLGAANNYLAQDLRGGRLRNNVIDAELVYADNFDIGPTNTAINLGANYRLRNADHLNIGGNRVEHHFGIFGQLNTRFSKALSLILSGRVDRVPYNDRFEASPRASVLVHPNDRSTIRASFSTAFRKPTFFEGYLQYPFQGPQGSVTSLVDTLKLGRINPEGILTAEIGYLNQMSDFFDVDVAAYYNRVTDLVTLAQPSFLTPSDRANGLGAIDPQTGRYTVQFSGNENGCVDYNVYGGELGARVYPVSGLDLFANYAINYTSEIRQPGCTIPTDERTSHHKINLGVQYRTKPGIDGEIVFNYVTDQRWVEREADATRGELVYKTLELPGYALLNARVGYRFMSNHAEVSVAAFNLLDNLHQEHPFTQWVGRRVMGFVQYQF